MPPIAVFSAVADETRCQILQLLQAGPKPVHVLAAHFDISRPAISRHLRVLKQARLIAERKQGRENVYFLDPEPLADASVWLASFKPEPMQDSPTPKREPKNAATPPRVRNPSAKSQMGFDF